MKIIVQSFIISLFLFLLAPGIQAQEQWVPFEKAGKWGYRDTQGKVAIKPKFILAQNFSPEGIAAVTDTAGWLSLDMGNNLMHFVKIRGVRAVSPHR